jgi:hypothetical protein
LVPLNFLDICIDNLIWSHSWESHFCLFPYCSLFWFSNFCAHTVKFTGYFLNHATYVDLLIEAIHLITMFSISGIFICFSLLASIFLLKPSMLFCMLSNFLTRW